MQSVVLGKIKLPFVVLLSVASALFISIAGLTFLGRWQPDEYSTGADFRREGLSYFMERVLTWSPRPLSELVLFAYHSLVETSGNPLIAETLLLLLFISGVAALWPATRWSSRWEITLPLGISILLLTLMGRKNDEVVYWVQAAIAYIPSIGAVLFATGVLLFGRADQKQWWIASVAFGIGALFSETVAFYVLPFSLGVVGAGLIGVLGLDRRVSISMAPALIPAFAVFALFATGRGSGSGEIFGDPSIAKSFGPSIAAAVLLLPLQLVLFDNNVTSGVSALAGMVAKGLFFLGSATFFARLPNWNGDKAAALMTIGAGISAMLLITFGGLYQFGMLCCQRHVTMQQFFSWIVILGAAKLLSRMLVFKRIGDGYAYSALTLAIVISGSFAAPAMFADYRKWGILSDPQRAVWASGNDKSNDIVRVPRIAPGQYVGPVGFSYLEPGRYGLDGPFHVTEILSYFGKSEAIVE